MNETRVVSKIAQKYLMLLEFEKVKLTEKEKKLLLDFATFVDNLMEDTPAQG